MYWYFKTDRGTYYFLTFYSKCEPTIVYEKVIMMSTTKTLSCTHLIVRASSTIMSPTRAMAITTPPIM